MSTSTPGHQGSSTSTSTPTDSPLNNQTISSSTELPEPTRAVTSIDEVIIQAENYGIQFTYDEYLFENGSSYLIFIDEHDLISDNNKMKVSAMDWEGNRQTLLSIDYSSQKPETDVAINAFPLPAGSPWLLLGYGSLTELWELYIVNLSTGESWGIAPGCSSLMRGSIGDKYLAYQCIDDEFVWNFIPLSNPDSRIPLSLSGATIEPFDSAVPMILGDLALFYPFLSNQVCNGIINDWQPHCWEIPFWLGPLSPTKMWFEVRSGSDHSPNEIGVTTAGCILLNDPRCNPILSPPPEDMAPPKSGDRYIGDSVWLPIEEGLLYMVHLDTDHTNQSPEESEVWMYSLSDHSFSRLYVLPGVQYFGDPRFDLKEPGYWSPDGRSVIISDWDTLSLLNIETGELTPLTEGGILLGEITLP
jgi:hypothetical protein